mgnify:CR=1 FL=1
MRTCRSEVFPFCFSSLVPLFPLLNYHHNLFLMGFHVVCDQWIFLVKNYKTSLFKKIVMVIFFQARNRSVEEKNGNDRETIFMFYVSCLKWSWNFFSFLVVTVLKEVKIRSGSQNLDKDRCLKYLSSGKQE